MSDTNDFEVVSIDLETPDEPLTRKDLEKLSVPWDQGLVKMDSIVDRLSDMETIQDRISGRQHLISTSLNEMHANQLRAWACKTAENVSFSQKQTDVLKALIDERDAGMIKALVHLNQKQEDKLRAVINERNEGLIKAHSNVVKATVDATNREDLHKTKVRTGLANIHGQVVTSTHKLSGDVYDTQKIIDSTDLQRREEYYDLKKDILLIKQFAEDTRKDVACLKDERIRELQDKLRQADAKETKAGLKEGASATETSNSGCTPWGLRLATAGLWSECNNHIRDGEWAYVGLCFVCTLSIELIVMSILKAICRSVTWLMKLIYQMPVELKLLMGVLVAVLGLGLLVFFLEVEEARQKGDCKREKSEGAAKLSSRLPSAQD